MSAKTLSSSSTPAYEGVPTVVSHEEVVAAKAISVSAFAGQRRGNGFVLQVGAMKNKGNAEELAMTLQSKGFPAFIRNGDEDALFRVQVGPYFEPMQAHAAGGQLRSAGFASILRPYGSGKMPGQ
jgi:cell division septation protein DedD